MVRRVVGLMPWVTAAALLGGFGMLVLDASRAEPRTGDGCPAETRGVHRIFVVDASDAVHASVLSQVARELRRIALSGGPDDRFSLFVVGGGDEPDLMPVFSGCNVGNQEMAGDLYRQRKATEFLQAPEAFLAGLVKSERATTPLLEALDTLLHRRDVFDAERVELWILSDFLQHTDRFSHYRGQRGLPEDETPGVRLAAARLLYLQRPGLRRIQTPEHAAAWVAYLARVSAAPPELEKF